jgi:hypothetical protein
MKSTSIGRPDGSIARRTDPSPPHSTLTNPSTLHCGGEGGRRPDEGVHTCEGWPELEPLWAKPRKSACNRTTGASLRSSPGHPRFNNAKALTRNRPAGPPWDKHQPTPACEKFMKSTSIGHPRGSRRRRPNPSPPQSTLTNPSTLHSGGEGGRRPDEGAHTCDHRAKATTCDSVPHSAPCHAWPALGTSLRARVGVPPTVHSPP